MVSRGLVGLEEGDARGWGGGEWGKNCPRPSTKYGGRQASKPLNSFLWSILRFNL